MPRHANVDIVMLGTSRGRRLSGYGNHLITEKELNCRVLNLSRSGGTGVVPMLMDLKWFFERGNRTKLVVYFIEPWVLYSYTWNEFNFLANPCFYKVEPFSLDYAGRILKAGGQDGLGRYIRAKFSLDWLNFTTDKKSIDNSQLRNPNLLAAKRRVGVLYDSGLKEHVFKRYAKKLEELTILANANDAKVMFVSLPTLLDEPGHDRLKQFIAELQSKHDVSSADLSNRISTPCYFSDYDHLNTKSIKLLLAEHLGPAVHKELQKTAQKNRSFLQ